MQWMQLDDDHLLISLDRDKNFCKEIVPISAVDVSFDGFGTTNGTLVASVLDLTENAADIDLDVVYQESNRRRFRCESKENAARWANEIKRNSRLVLLRNRGVHRAQALMASLAQMPERRDALVSSLQSLQGVLKDVGAGMISANCATVSSRF